MNKISKRELEILSWAAEGKTYPEISTILEITEDTAKAHVESVRQKLNAKNKTHAVAIALRSSIIV